MPTTVALEKKVWGIRLFAASINPPLSSFFLCPARSVGLKKEAMLPLCWRLGGAFPLSLDVTDPCHLYSGIVVSVPRPEETPDGSAGWVHVYWEDTQQAGLFRHGADGKFELEPLILGLPAVSQGATVLGQSLQTPNKRASRGARPAVVEEEGIVTRVINSTLIEVKYPSSARAQVCIWGAHGHFSASPCSRPIRAAGSAELGPEVRRRSIRPLPCSGLSRSARPGLGSFAPALRFTRLPSPGVVPLPPRARRARPSSSARW